MIHADLRGPMVPSSYRGSKYMWCGRDQASGALFACGVRAKTEMQLMVAMHQMRYTLDLANFNELGCDRPGILHFDNESGVVESSLCAQYMAMHNMTVKKGIPHRPNSNARAEQSVRAIGEKMTLGLTEACLGLRHWDSVTEVMIARHNLEECNLQPKVSLVDLDRRLGLFCMVHLSRTLKGRRKKTETRAFPAVYVGVDFATTRGVRIVYYDSVAKKARRTTVLEGSCHFCEFLAYERHLVSDVKTQIVDVAFYPSQTVTHMGVSAGDLPDADGDVTEVSKMIEWVACDRCNKWRIVSDNDKKEQLVFEHAHWECSTVGKSCDDPEDEDDQEDRDVEFGEDVVEVDEQVMMRTAIVNKGLNASLPVGLAGSSEGSRKRSRRIFSLQVQASRMGIDLDLPVPMQYSVTSSRAIELGEHVSQWQGQISGELDWEPGEPTHAECSSWSVVMPTFEKCGPVINAVWNKDKIEPFLAMLTKALTQKGTRDYPNLDWVAALNKEVKTLCGFKTVGHVVHISTIASTAHCARLLCVYAIKNADLPESEYIARARLVFGGNRIWTPAREEAVFDKMFSLPANSYQIRSLLITAMLKGYCVRQFDVSGAYLHAKIKEPTYVIIPEEVEKAFIEAMNLNQKDVDAIPLKKRVWPLLKALYGHPLAGFLWDEEFAKVLESLGFKQMRDIAPSLYVKNAGTQSELIVLIYVDDGLCVGHAHDIRVFQKALADKVTVKVFEELDRMLGTDYQINLKMEGPRVHELDIRMNSYVRNMVEKFTKDSSSKSLSGRTVRTPCVEQPMPNDEEPGKLAETCRSHVGTALFAVGAALPADAHAVGVMARRVSNWTITDDELMQRYMAYSEQHSQEYLVLSVHEDDWKYNTLMLVGYSDADYAGCRRTRKSTSGRCFMLHGKHGTRALINWKSQCQKTVTTSTGESEVTAMYDAGKELLQLLLLFETLMGRPLASLMLVDATVALQSVRAGFSQKMRHCRKTNQVSIAWLHQFFKDLSGHINTHRNPSDLFTKELCSEVFLRHKRYLGMVNPECDGGKRCPCQCRVGPCLMDMLGERSRCGMRVQKGAKFCDECSGSECECGCLAYIKPTPPKDEVPDDVEPVDS